MDRASSPAPLLWAVILGVALGGFFDGILLHQVLQWHHLLSLVPSVDLRGQILWDGLFHVGIYGLMALGLWGLWRQERRGEGLGGRRALGGLALGFGIWQFLDVGLAHWVLSIHRVRVDVPNPLAWDLGWTFIFGVVPALLGWRLLRSGGDGGRMRLAAWLLLPMLGLGVWAGQPMPGQALTVAVFRPGLAPERIEAGIEELGGRVVWSGPEMDVALIDMPADRRWSLYARGALMVSGAGTPAGCFGWSEA
jgi:uncharacterized membrane protein